MPQVVVTIDGKTYRMACAEGEEDHLTSLAERFDRNLAQLREAFGSIGDQRLTVMTGISVMDQLVDAERKLSEQGGRLEELTRERDASTDEVGRAETELGERLQQLTGRIEALAKTLSRRGGSAE